MRFLSALPARLRAHWQLIALTTLVYLLWNTDFVMPLKVLVVFLHELSHALATWLTGGEVMAMSIDADQGGEMIGRGGNRFVISSAGYLGSLMIGMAIFLVAVRTNADRAVMAIFGVTMLMITALYFRQVFSILFGSIGGLAMLASAWKLGRPVNDLFLRVIGLTSLLYVPHDIFSDTIARSGMRSDARILAETFGGTTLFWGGLWLLLSLAAVGLCARFGLGASSNITFGPAARNTGM